MKRKWMLPISLFFLIFLLFITTGCGNGVPTTMQAQDVLADNNAMADIPPQQGGLHRISSQRAREIAVDFVGYGIVHDVMAFTDGGVLLFEVDVRYNAMRYVVLINAENGNVTRLSRYEDETAPHLNVIPDYPPHVPNLNVIQ